MSLFNRDESGDPRTWGTITPRQHRRAPGELLTGESAAPGVYRSTDDCRFAVRIMADAPVLPPCHACANSCGWKFMRAVETPAPAPRLPLG